MFFFIFINYIYSVLYPPAFLLEQSVKQKKTLESLRIISDVNYKGLDFKETLLYKNPASYRIVLEKDSDAILFIREAEDCIAISKSKNLNLKCSNYLNSVPYNVYFNTGVYFRFLKNFGITFQISDDELKIDKETSALIKPENVALLKIEDKPVFVVGLTEAELKPYYEEARTKKLLEISAYVLDKILYLKPQVWIDQTTLLPSRIFGANNGKNLEIFLKFYINESETLSYPKILEILEDKNLILSYKVAEYYSKLKASDNIFKLNTYKEKFSELEKTQLNENKTLMLDYLRNYR